MGVCVGVCVGVLVCSFVRVSAFWLGVALWLVKVAREACDDIQNYVTRDEATNTETHLRLVIGYSFGSS